MPVVPAMTGAERSDFCPSSPRDMEFSDQNGEFLVGMNQTSQRQNIVNICQHVG